VAGPPGIARLCTTLPTGCPANGGPRLRGDDPVGGVMKGRETTLVHLQLCCRFSPLTPFSKYLSTPLWGGRIILPITSPGRASMTDGGEGQAGAGETSFSVGSQAALARRNGRPGSLVQKSCHCEASRPRVGWPPGIGAPLRSTRVACRGLISKSFEATTPRSPAPRLSGAPSGQTGPAGASARPQSLAIQRT
jgi:hypothetical protein